MNLNEEVDLNDFNAGREVLETSKKNEEVLDMDSGAKQTGIRGVHQEREGLSGPPSVIRSAQGADSSGEADLSQVRQSSVRESESSVVRDGQPERSGRSKEEETQELKEDALSQGASALAPESSPEAGGNKNLPTMRKGSVGEIQTQTRSQVEADDKGLLRGGSLDAQYRLARFYHASRLMPAALDSPEKILVAVQICLELGLKPMSSIGKIAVINGVPSLFGDLPLALVFKSGLLAEMDENVEMKDGQPVSATCVVRRIDRKAITRTFTMAEAKQAGLIDKTRSVWKTYPRRMIQMRARSHALKDAFPDILLGLSIAEYEGTGGTDDGGRFVGDQGERAKSPAEEMNQQYLEKKETENGN